MHRERTFFGILSVFARNEGLTRSLMHGRIGFGQQMRSLDPQERRRPLLYYYPTGPIGQFFKAFRGSNAKKTVAVVGLGVGSLAGYAEARQEFTFFEIDPGVERIARNPDYFTFLRDAETRGANVRVVLGDARLSLRGESSGHYGVIILDAFSGDAIPTHLLTREAVQLYLEKLADDGVLAFHISNIFLNLAPVLADQALEAKLIALIEDDRDSTGEEPEGKAGSTWVLMARHPRDLEPIAANPRWQPLSGKEGTSVWTDDYSNIFQVFRWR
jgi:hypothetical protein